MQRKIWLALGTCLALGTAYARPFQDDGMGMDPQMMEKMIALTSPGEQHEVLGERVGKWNMAIKYFPGPGAPPMESTGTSQAKWVMDGRYIVDNTTGAFMGQPFEGMAIAGFDNIKKKYFSTWMDNMGTGFAFSEGSYDAAKRTFTYQGTMPDPMSGSYVSSKMIEKWVDDDTWTFEMHAPGPDGAMHRMMEITYERAE